MPIEKAFAIQASPQAIYSAIEAELAEAWSHEGDTFQVLRREPGRAIDLRVTIGGVPCWLTYRIEQGAGHSEVVARLTPFGLKHALFRIVTLGQSRQGYEVALVQGLANLKAAVERRTEGDDEPRV
jgi:hypothetical protein